MMNRSCVVRRRAPPGTPLPLPLAPLPLGDTGGELKLEIFVDSDMAECGEILIGLRGELAGEATLIVTDFAMLDGDLGDFGGGDRCKTGVI